MVVEDRTLPFLNKKVKWTHERQKEMLVFLVFSFFGVLVPLRRIFLWQDKV